MPRRARQPSPARIARWKWTTRLAYMVVALIALIATLDHLGVFRSTPPEGIADQTPLTTNAKTSDGDTIEATLNGRRIRIRLIGVDAAELNLPDGPPDYWAEEATAFVRSHVEGRDVRLQFKPSERHDAYGRVLAYIILPNGENLNLKLIAEGHAKAHRRFPHPLSKEFEAAEAKAKARRLGRWK